MSSSLAEADARGGDHDQALEAQRRGGVAEAARLVEPPVAVVVPRLGEHLIAQRRSRR